MTTATSVCSSAGSSLTEPLAGGIAGVCLRSTFASLWNVPKPDRMLGSRLHDRWPKWDWMLRGRDSLTGVLYTPPGSPVCVDFSVSIEDGIRSRTLVLQGDEDRD